MSNPTAAQEELADLLAKNAANTGRGIHPEDRDYEANEAATHSEDDEEERFRAAQIDAAMRMPTHDSRADIRLPPPSFDSGCATGVKGVIADARSYETARREKWTSKMRSARRSVFGINGGGGSKHHHHDESGTESDASAAALDDPEEEAFIQRWREERRRQLEAVGTSAPPPARSRRTSPSVRRYGRLDQVDALGYLDAIEKVRRETVVVVFVYDHEVRVLFGFLVSYLSRQAHHRRAWRNPVLAQS